MKNIKLRYGGPYDKFMTKLPPLEEQQFRNWYNSYSSQTGNSWNPDDPQHMYDYRGYWRSTGGAPITNEHLPDTFKLPGHESYIRTDKEARADNMYGRTESKYKFNNGGSITNLSDNQYSSGIFKFNGPSHEQGGIPIAYNGTEVEVEGDETGYIDKSGDLNVFGNMYVPGTRQKFKSLSKDIAKAEQKANNRLKRSADLMNTVNDFDSPLERLRANSASIMGKSAMRQQQAATMAKENLASLQNQMLDYSSSLGISPKEIFGRPKANDGVTVPLKDRRKREEEMLSPFVPDYNARFFGQPANVQVPYDRLGYDLEPIQGVRRDKPVSAKLTSKAPSIQELRTPRSMQFDSPDPTVYNEPLSLGQIGPELYTLATNRQEFVPSQFYTPQLYQNYRVSFADRLNQNNSTFRAIAANQTNPAVMGQLAAQKYASDQSVLSDEYRANQSIQDQITNRNIELINQAQMTNINIGRENAEFRAQNAAATRATTREAIKSISNKFVQQKQYNKGLTLYSQMIPHYKYDPTSGTWNFESQGPADINVGGYSTATQQSSSPSSVNNLYGESRVTNYNRDSKGRILQRSEQRSPGLLRIFRRGY